MTIELEKRKISVSDIEIVGIDYSSWLDDGELLTDVTVAEVVTTALTLADEAVSAETLKILNVNVPAGKAITFKVTTPDDAGLYKVLVTVLTDAGREVNRIVRLDCV